MKSPRSLLIVFCIFALGYVGCENSSSGPKHSKAYTDGYAMGKTIGEVHRDNGTCDINQAKAQLDAPEMKGLPRVGSPEYGDFMKGFEKGYFKAVSKSDSHEE